ncbi:50S ribosomal protein L30 [Candidatus Woesearchaeota archaeon]|nr:50S ribosomal protein L30 [Candidatus Woesearchaeota archaeon]|tara:strand:+ start:12194 stop:12679 length:486 start_codon:yes stop_codon:yes gene_type:complete
MVQEKNKENKELSKALSASNGKLAIIRIRGLINIQRDIKRTLNQLKLYKKNFCVVIANNKSSFGMVTKVKDYVTWGEIDNETYDILIDKKSEEYKDRLTDRKQKIEYNRFLDAKGKKIKKFFRLNSPRKGYGRKGIKVPFNKGGALGYRAEKINELIKRMI